MFFAFLIYLVFSAVKRINTNNNMAVLMSDIKGFMWLFIVLALVITVDSKKRFNAVLNAIVIGADDEELHGMMIKKQMKPKKVTKISVEDIIRIFDWTGMLMCVRKEFFEQRKGIISEISAPHDFVLALSATDCEQFYVYDYVGAYHRRRSNNAANEEHRISRILNLKRKIRDKDNYNGYLYNVANSNIEIQKTV